MGKKRLVHVAVSFGSGTTDLYTTGGIPLEIAKLGLSRNIDSVAILESNGDALLYEWDRSANTIRIFYPTQETGSTANRAGVEFTGEGTAIGTTTLELKVIGW